MAQCLTPFNMTNKMTGEIMHLPCGRCYPCTMRRVSGWSFRLVQEDKRAYTSAFVTLTYNTKNIPIGICKNCNTEEEVNNYKGSGYKTLCKKCLQNFFKRLRYYEKEERYLSDSRNNCPIRYYACGEYGSKHYRPHYHIILFNASVKAIEKAWTKDGKPLGDIFYGTVAEASIGYCLKYINKPSKIPMHKNDDRLKEFAIMSKRLGDNYINERTKKWHHSNLENNFYLPLQGGKKASIPRYYKQKMFSKEQLKAVAFFKKQQKEKEEPITEKERIEKIKKNSEKLKKIHDERTRNNYH